MAVRKSDPGEEAAPAGFDMSAATFVRARRLAMALFGDAVAQVTLITAAKVWRSGGSDYCGEIETVGVREAMSTGEIVWVEDARRDPRFCDDRMVKGPLGLRFFAAAPIRLTNGSNPGALWLAGPTPRRRDEDLAARLQDLADFITDEWTRAKTKRAKDRQVRESRAVRRTMGSIIDSAPLSVLMLDRELRIMAASRRWLESRNLIARDVTGKLLAEVMPQARHWRAGFERVLAGESIQSDRGRVEGANGSVQWVRAELTPWRDASGDVGGIIISSFEITDMVEALERSERSEERLKLALEIADVHVWEINHVRNEVINTSGPEHATPDIYGKMLVDIWSAIDPRDRVACEAAWERHVNEGAPYRPEFRVARSDGQELWVTGSVRVFADEQGNAQRTVGAMQNITDRKLAERALVQAKEEAEAANRAKSAFLATMSHEIRTPLNGVLGMAQAMARDELTTTQRERVDVIRTSGEALLAILNDVLDLSKIEAGKLTLEHAEFEIGELARSVHATFAATAQAKGLEFSLSISRAAQGVYVGDSVRVRQILSNLVSNALKFTEKGSVKLAVGRAREALTLTVCDSGIGIPAEKLAVLFQKFEQADASTTRRYGGTGLGLAICRDLAEMMGGQIIARSKSGAGTTFVAELPLTRVARSTRKASSKPARAPAKARDLGLRVLAAEDNSMNQLVLKTLLAQIGVEPFIVGDGRAAVSAWENEPWDLILMDVQMPEMDGPTATAIIRARERAEGRPRTPIVALTANAMAHQVAEYAAAGMDAYVAKPIEAGRLFEAILNAAKPASEGSQTAAA